MLVILLIVLAFLIYQIVTAHTVQPLTIIILIVVVFALIRVLFRMRSKVPGDESE